MLYRGQLYIRNTVLGTKPGNYDQTLIEKNLYVAADTCTKRTVLLEAKVSAIYRFDCI